MSVYSYTPAKLAKLSANKQLRKKKENPQGKALRVSTSQLHEKKRNFYLTKVVKKLITYSPRKFILRQTNRR